MLTWLDLCSGLGGASQPAKDRGWKVIRVDIDPRFKPDIVADVRALPFAQRCSCGHLQGQHWDGGVCDFDCDCLNPKSEWRPPFPVDVLWASPPCIEFARAELPWLKKRFPGLVPDVSIAAACRHLVAYFTPRIWVIENTRNSLRWLRPLLGGETVSVEGHYFWGNLPLIPQSRRVPKQDLWPSEWRQAERAKIPYEIGEAICRAVEHRIAT